MDPRIYFIVGDVISNTLVSALVGMLCALTVGTGWPMFTAMVLCMVGEMAVALVMFFPLSIFFGAMEIMVSTMFSGMLTGMVVGMWCAMMPLGLWVGILLGAVCGLLSLMLIWFINNRLRGVRRYPAGDGHVG